MRPAKWSPGIWQQPRCGSPLAKDANGAVVSLNVGGSNNVAYVTPTYGLCAKRGNGAFLGQVVTNPGPVFDGSGDPVLDSKGQPALETISEVRLNGNANELIIATRPTDLPIPPLPDDDQQFQPGSSFGHRPQQLPGSGAPATALSDGSIQLGGTSNAKIQVSTEAIVDIEWNQAGTILGALDAKGNLFLLYNPGTSSYNLVPVSNSAITLSFCKFAFSSDSQSWPPRPESGLIHEWDLAPAIKTPKFQFTLPASATYPSGVPVGLWFDLHTRWTLFGGPPIRLDFPGFGTATHWISATGIPLGSSIPPSWNPGIDQRFHSQADLHCLQPQQFLPRRGNEFGQVEVFDLTRFRLISRTMGSPTSVVNLGFSASSRRSFRPPRMVGSGDSDRQRVHVATFRDANQKLVAFSSTSIHRLDPTASWRLRGWRR